MAFDPKLFLDAQAPIYGLAVRELKAGRKQSHWMWFVFPQLGALGKSPTSIKFGLANLADAKAYLAHPELGPRLIECTKLANAIEGRTAVQVFDKPDDLKFRSSMTLFARAAPDEPAFKEAIAKYFGGREDDRTAALVG